jgi:hypothetical protein
MCEQVPWGGFLESLIQKHLMPFSIGKKLCSPKQKLGASASSGRAGPRLWAFCSCILVPGTVGRYATDTCLYYTGD